MLILGGWISLLCRLMMAFAVMDRQYTFLFRSNWIVRYRNSGGEEGDYYRFRKDIRTADFFYLLFGINAWNVISCICPAEYEHYPQKKYPVLYSGYAGEDETAGPIKDIWPIL